MLNRKWCQETDTDELIDSNQSSASHDDTICRINTVITTVIFIIMLLLLLWKYRESNRLTEKKHDDVTKVSEVISCLAEKLFSHRMKAKTEFNTIKQSDFILIRTWMYKNVNKQNIKSINKSNIQSSINPCLNKTN